MEDYYSSELEDKFATHCDAAREYAFNVGKENRNIAWILTPYDTFVKNPFYKGLPQPYPEY